MLMGKIDGDPIEIETNIDQSKINPLIASSFLLPVADYKNAKKIDIPYSPPTSISMSNAYSSYCQFLMNGPVDSTLNIELRWQDKINYTVPKPKDIIYLRLSGLMSIITYKMFENADVNLHPFILSTSLKEKKNQLKRLRELGITKNVPSIYIKYDNIDLHDILPRHIDWMASTSASLKASRIWLAVPYPERTDYFLGKTNRIFSEGSHWLTKMMGRNILIESPFGKSKTRYDIIKSAMDNFDIDINFITRAMDCNCGDCPECLTNKIMFKKLGLKNPSEVFDRRLSKKTISRLKKLLELNKLDILFVQDIKEFLA